MSTSDVNSYTIITTAANKTIQPLHDRMPAISLPEEIDTWLDPEYQDAAGTQDLLRPYPDDGVKFHPVSRCKLPSKLKNPP